MWTGSPVWERSRPTRSRRSQPERSPGNVDTMSSSVRSSSMASMAATNGSGCAIWPCDLDPLRAEDGKGGAEPALGLRMLAPSGVALRADDEEARRPLICPRAYAVEKLLVEHGLVCDDEDVGGCSARDIGDDMLDGAVPRGFAESRREGSCEASRTWSPGCVHTTISSISSDARTSLTAVSGSSSNTAPCAGTPASRSAARTRSSRRPAAARRESR